MHQQLKKNKMKAAIEEYLSRVIEPTDIKFRIKVKSKDSLFTEDIETKTLAELIEHFSLKEAQKFKIAEEMVLLYHDIATIFVEDPFNKFMLDKRRETIRLKMQQIENLQTEYKKINDE